MNGKEVVSLMGCSRSMLSQYKRMGLIRAERSGKGFDYSEEDVRKMMDKNKQLDHQLATRLVTVLGYDPHALRSRNNSRPVSDQRRVVATVLYRQGYSMADIARFLERTPSSISYIVHTAYLVEKEVETAERMWSE